VFALAARLAGTTPALVHAALADDFVITVKTDNSGTSGSTQFTIPTYAETYDYNVDCNNDGTNEATARRLATIPAITASPGPTPSALKTTPASRRAFPASILLSQGMP